MKRFRIKVWSILAILTMASLYFSGIVLSVRDGSLGEGNIWMPFQKVVSEPGGLKVWQFCLMMLLSAAALYVHLQWKEERRRDQRGFLYSSQNLYGNAVPARPEDYRNRAAIRPVEECRGIIVGQLDPTGKRCIDYEPVDGRANYHMLVIGTSGTGKSFTFVKTNLYQAEKRRHSVILTDPDGGLFRDTAGFFQDRGYIVRCLNFKNLQLSDGWDCMAELYKEPERMLDNADIFANTIMRNITREESVFARAAGSLLKALLLRVILGHDYGPGQKNIREVFKLLQNPGGMAFYDQLFDKRLLRKDEWLCIEPYLSFKHASEGLSGNVITELANGLSLFQNPDICDVLSTPDLDLVLPGKEPCIYYCQFPDTHDTYRFLISLFFSLLFTALCDYADLHTEDGRLPRAVDFLLDEFPSIGILPDWERKMAVVRKRNMNVTMIIQGLPQLQNNYKDSWITIGDNCDTTIILGANDPVVTAPWVAKKAGTTTIRQESYSDNGKGIGQSGIRRNQSDTKRDLYNVGEVLQIQEDDAIVSFARKNAFLCHKTPHTLHPSSKVQRKILPGEIIPFRQKKQRAFLRKTEEKYREQYWNRHRKEMPVSAEEEMNSADYEYGDPLQLLWKLILHDGNVLLRLLRGKRENDTSMKRRPAAEEECPTGAFLQFLEQEKKIIDFESLHLSPNPEPEEPSVGFEEPKYTQQDLLEERAERSDDLFSSILSRGGPRF